MATEIMLDIYRQMYSEALPSVNFDDLMDKADINELGQKIISFDNYFLAQERQEQIIKEHLKSKRLTKLKKQAISNSLWLGCSPSSANFYFILERKSDKLIKKSDSIRWIEFNEDKTFKEWYDTIKVGRSLLMSPLNAFFTWQTTPVTEIISQKENIIEFKTENSTYTLTKIIVDE